MCQKTLVIPDASQEGMLFVRFTYILTTMVKAPIIAVCFFLIALSSSVQYALSSPKVLEFSIYADGTTHVFYQTDVDPQSPDFALELYGNTTNNLVAQDENGTLLSSKVNANDAVIETLGASTIKVDYDTPDLVSKIGKTWTFQVNSTVDFSVLLPKNTVIVGISSPPLNLQIVDNQSLISLPNGTADISYVFGVLGTSQTATLAIQKAHDFIGTVNSEGIPTPLASAKLNDANTAFNQGKYSDAESLANDAKNLAVQEQQTALSAPKSSPENNNMPILIAAGAAAAGTTAFIILRKNRATKSVIIPPIPQTNYIPPDKETIFRLKPELRQEDKEMVAFISEKGGRVFESELRKKFLLPRTTMWRAVKRLEREGIVEIEKVDQQNLIKLRKIEEEGQE
ncbi:MAG: helix-turn-helix transcriptional regulator [Nitrosotalea sp.]